jgi:predicted RNA methylase
LVIRLIVDSGARDGHTFYDLGSGSGRAVVSASLSGVSFLKCIGIEILPALCDSSREIVDSVKKIVDVETRNSSYTSKLLDITLPIVNIVEGDVMCENWSDADVIFVSFGFFLCIY